MQKRALKDPFPNFVKILKIDLKKLRVTEKQFYIIYCQMHGKQWFPGCYLPWKVLLFSQCKQLERIQKLVTNKVIAHRVMSLVTSDCNRLPTCNWMVPVTLLFTHLETLKLLARHHPILRHHHYLPTVAYSGTAYFPLWIWFPSTYVRFV